MNEERRKIVEMVCEDYIDTILVGMEEYEKDFPFTIACANFLKELRSKNIKVRFEEIFIEMVRDNIYRETSNYLAR